MIEELATAASLFSYGQEPESVHALAGAVALGTMYPGSNWSVKGGNQARGFDKYRIIIIFIIICHPGCSAFCLHHPHMAPYGVRGEGTLAAS